MMLPATVNSCLKYIHTNFSINIGTGTWYIEQLNDLYPKTSAGNTRPISLPATVLSPRLDNTTDIPTHLVFELELTPIPFLMELFIDSTVDVVMASNDIEMVFCK